MIFKQEPRTDRDGKVGLGITKIGCKGDQAMNIRTQSVIDFHKLFDHPIGEGEPSTISDDRIRFRLRTIFEEAFELIEACAPTVDISGLKAQCDSLINCARLQPDLVKIADALTDLQYFEEGFAIECGYDPDAIFEEVHRSNMEKSLPCETCQGNGRKRFFNRPCDDCNGKGRIIFRRDDSKVIKPEGWKPPNIAGALRPLSEE